MKQHKTLRNHEGGNDSYRQLFTQLDDYCRALRTLIRTQERRKRILHVSHPRSGLGSHSYAAHKCCSAARPEAAGHKSTLAPRGRGSRV
eukprot:411848-Amphidinium_carterae.1